jgi:hypothetical protein
MSSLNVNTLQIDGLVTCGGDSQIIPKSPLTEKIDRNQRLQTSSQLTLIEMTNIDNQDFIKLE